MNDVKQVIVIDDEKHLRITVQQTLELAGYEVDCFASATAALKELTPDWPGVVISDIRMPGMDGLTFMSEALAIDRDLPVILITGHGDISMAVSAIREGAYDFIEKPFGNELLVDVVKRAVEKRRLTLENRELKRELAVHSAPGPRIIGKTPAMQRLLGLISQIAEVDADVLLFGETGVGKDLIARYIHDHSARQGKNFVAVNCGAIPESIIESELFGHEAGAFTGAQQRRIGKFEHANGGTLFLDEIESMPLALQVKLLRVLQERCIERLGSNELIPLDLRIIAATKADLKELSEKGEFRQDLYYRLNVVTLDIPPLRDRLEDLPLLFQHFVLIAANRVHKEVPPLDSARLSTLMAHSWPGNVRELRNLAERYVLLGQVNNYDLEQMLHGSEAAAEMTLPQQVEQFERSLIEQELARQKGSIKETMEVLGLPRKTLYDKMRKYGLNRDDFR